MALEQVDCILVCVAADCERHVNHAAGVNRAALVAGRRACDAGADALGFSGQLFFAGTSNLEANRRTLLRWKQGMREGKRAKR